MSQPLWLYNSVSLKKELFKPIQDNKVQMYCCGPTVYHYAHIGNLRTYIFEDFLRRTLDYLKYEVNHVINITDVGHLTSDADTGEDKLEKGAQREKKTVWEIAEFYTQHFKNDCQKLNILQPAHWPKATDYIQQQIKLIKVLEQKKVTYRTDDGIYFDTSQFPRYADFARLDVENLEAGKHIAINQKRQSTDFALWKFSPTETQRAMEWGSPWGKGFPGWHVECSAMAMEILGEQIDIHCGGIDHLRVHHTNEIAQSECATGKTYARYWVHGGWLLENDNKMSKSNNEFVRLESLIQKQYNPLSYRYFCMNSHYRNYLSFTWKNLKVSHLSLKNLKQKTAPLIQNRKKISMTSSKNCYNQFMTAICDDLNLPKALGILHLMLKDNDIVDSEKGALLFEFNQILGLDLHQEFKNPKIEIKQEWLDLIEERNQARKNKNFTRADEIRIYFEQQGFTLKDRAQSTTLEPKK